MRFVHSFSTRPLSINLYNTDDVQRTIGNIVYYATSLAYLKNLNQTVVLHTDTKGMEMLDYLPYDEIHLTLDEIPNTISPRFWAAGKFYAMEKEPLNSVHIDGDVFIKTQTLIDMIENQKYDLIVQNVEDGKIYRECAKLIYAEQEWFTNLGIDINDTSAYCTGIVGFNNQELKTKFIESYKKTITFFSEKYPILLKKNMFLTPDLVCEQLMIEHLSRDYKVYTLLRISDENPQLIIEDAKNIGYQHTLTISKFKHLDKCWTTLKNISPIIYKNTHKICQKILNK